MTFEQLRKIFEVNRIPESARLMSDSGWEVDATDMGGAYYNPSTNTVVFTMGFSEYDHYSKNPEKWKALQMCDVDSDVDDEKVPVRPVRDDRAEFVGQLIDSFEDFLESKGIDIENPDKEQSDNPAILYGTDYGQIQTELEDTLVKWGVINPR